MDATQRWGRENIKILKFHFKNNAAATSGSHGGKILKFHFKSSMASASGLYENKILKFYFAHPRYRRQTALLDTKF